MRSQQSMFVSSLKSTENEELDLLNPDKLESEDSHAQEDSSLICSLCRERDSKKPIMFSHSSSGEHCFSVNVSHNLVPFFVISSLKQKSRLSSFVGQTASIVGWKQQNWEGSYCKKKAKNRFRS